jgi:hypothetical protein
MTARHAMRWWSSREPWAPIAEHRVEHGEELRLAAGEGDLAGLVPAHSPEGSTGTIQMRVEAVTNRSVRDSNNGLETRYPIRAMTRRLPPKVKKARPADKIVRAAVAHESQPTSGGKIALTLRIALSRRQAERLTARAIREGKNLNALIGEILEAAPAEPTG